MDRLAPRCTGGRRSAGRRQRRSRPAGELARRQPVVGRAFRPNRVARARDRLGGAGVHRLEPGDPRAVANARRRRRAADRHACGLARRRIDPAWEAVVCVVRPLRRRPPHRRPQRLHARRGSGDRAWNPTLPRAGERLERHRLQLPRRPLRDGLRRPLRRDRAQRRRRARARVQHRFGRGGRDRHVRAGSAAGCGRGRTRTASRLAARPGSRGAADDPERPLRRQPALPARNPRLPPRCLRSPRHRFHGVPRRRALRSAQRDRGRCGGDRPAEALRASRDRHGRRPCALPRSPVGLPPVAGDRTRCDRRGRRHRQRHRDDGGLVVGRERSRCRVPTGGTSAARA